jgi:hypothetical protein
MEIDRRSRSPISPRGRQQASVSPRRDNNGWERSTSRGRAGGRGEHRGSGGAGARGGSPPPPSNVLGVFGMSVRTRERDLEELFGKFGELERVSIVYDAYVSCPFLTVSPMYTTHMYIYIQIITDQTIPSLRVRHIFVRRSGVSCA